MNWVVIILLVILFLEIESLKKQRIVIVKKSEPQSEPPGTVESDVIDEMDELIQTEENEE